MLVVFNINNITTLGLANNTSLTLSSWILTLTLVFNTKLQLQPPNQQTKMVLVGFSSSGPHILSRFGHLGRSKTENHAY